MVTSPEEGIPSRLALLVEYDGTRYKGFQLQADASTVQAELEKAIRRLTGELIRIRGASRTDSGAHARGQVVDFLTRNLYPEETVVKALNWYLPPDIRIREAREVPPEFNSRKAAVGRVYRYTIVNRRTPPALKRDFSHWVRSHLDLGKMRQAATCLLGAHDFSVLAAGLPPGKSGVRQVKRWEIWREGESVAIESEANGFLPRQIRRTNGILVEVGMGRMPVRALEEILNGAVDEHASSPSLPAKGLCLMSVSYPNPLFRNEVDYEA